MDRPPLLSGFWTPVDRGRRPALQMYARSSTSSAGVAASSALPATTPIVLVHGLGVSSRYMIPTLRLLARNRVVSAPDLPGFGASDKPPEVLGIAALADSLTEWLERNALSQSVLLGNSVGCQVISSLASRYPRMVRAAVLVSPTMDPASSGPVRDLVRLVLDGPRERVSEIPLALADYRKAGLRRIVRTFSDAIREPVTAQLRAMSMPTLVVRGSRDPIVSDVWARRVAELLPNGRLVVIDDAPHAVNYTAPRDLVAAVEAFLDDM